ncbi:MAG TPA: hypothetical protein VFJ71_12160 [Candidatus Limnocylindrales bacterium]|nr:hypothetical protein [Candidatus Limnocylindrales bacterium]
MNDAAIDPEAFARLDRSARSSRRASSNPVAIRSTHSAGWDTSPRRAASSRLRHSSPSWSAPTFTLLDFSE